MAGNKINLDAPLVKKPIIARGTRRSSATREYLAHKLTVTHKMDPSGLNGLNEQQLEELAATVNRPGVTNGQISQAILNLKSKVPTPLSRRMVGSKNKPTTSLKAKIGGLSQQGRMQQYLIGKQIAPPKQ